MSFLTILLVSGIFALVLLAILNRRAFSSLWFWSRSQAGKMGRAVSEADPVGQMRQAADDETDRLAKARDALVKSKALEKTLTGLMESAKHDAVILELRINKRLDAGDKPEKLTNLAEQLAYAQKTTAGYEKQLADNARFYAETMKTVQAAGQKISEVKQRADRLEVQLDLSKAQAELASLNDTFHPESLTQALHTASKFEAAAERRIAENQARLTVNAELNGPDYEADERSNEAESVMAGILAKREGAKA